MDDDDDDDDVDVETVGNIPDQTKPFQFSGHGGERSSVDDRLVFTMGSNKGIGRA